MTPPETSDSSSRAPVILALLTVQVLFGLHYYAAKVVLAHVPPPVWAALRVTGAAVLLIPIAVVLAPRATWPRRSDWLPLAGLSLLGVVVNQLCFVEGLSRTTLSHASLINCSIPVLTLLLAVLLRRERPEWKKLLAITISLAGVLILLRVDALRWDRMARGDLYTVANAASYSFFLVLSRPLITRLDPLLATSALLGLGSVGLLPIGIPGFGELAPSTWPFAVWAWGAFVIIGATVIAYTLNTVALRRVDSSMVAFFIFLQPLLAASLDRFVIGTPWDGRVGVSALLIAAGVVLALAPGRRRGAASGRSFPQALDDEITR